MIFVRVDDLKPGMRLAKPIYNKNGVLLHDRDTRLTMQAIYGVKNFRLIGLYILEPAEPVPPMTEEDINFERFQTMGVFSIKEDLELISEGKDDKGLDWLCNLVIRNYSGLDHKINFIQSLRGTDDYLYKHSLNVAVLTAVIAGKMSIPSSRMKNLITAAVLHDCGGVGFKGFSEAEYDKDLKIKIRNTTMEILDKRKSIDESVLRHIRHMQQMYIAEEEEDLIATDAARADVNASILYVADAFDRMTAMKSQEEPTSEVTALRKLLANPSVYDPVVVQALINGINVLKPGVCVELTVHDHDLVNPEEELILHERGLVIVENNFDIFKPWVLRFSNNQLYDLSSEEGSFIELTDIMKTMDNRIKLDPKLLEEYNESTKEQ